MKIHKKIILTAMNVVILSTNISAATKSIFIDNRVVSMDVQQIDGRTFIPLRKVAEEFGMTTNYAAKDKINGNKSISIYGTDKESGSLILLNMNVGSKKAVINRKEITLDVAPKIINNMVYVPLRIVGEVFNSKVDYISGQVRITTNFTNEDTNPYQNIVEPINIDKNKSTITSKEMKTVGVNFNNIGNEKVASLWNSAVYYTVGSSIIKTKHMLGERQTVVLSDIVRQENGVIIFPKDVMDYLYVDERDIDTALKSMKCNYDDVKDYWKKGK